MVAENVRNIHLRIASACARAGRRVEDVTLVAVTKSFSSQQVRQVVEAGVYDVGENFVQELLRKRDEFQNDQIRWHFIGHLQSNKVKYLAEWIHLIHSVDSLNLGREISRRAEEAGRTIDILVEVNTTTEKSKYGIDPDAASALVKDLASLPLLNVLGLMTIGRFLPDPEGSRPAFRTLSQIRIALEKEGLKLRDLSMGMTNDFEVAIEEGATIVRLGTAIFGKRTKKREHSLAKEHSHDDDPR